MAKLENLALADTNDLPIKHMRDVYGGKVRSVYWLTCKDSERLIEKRNYDISPSQLGVMITSDRISAFDCIWQGEEGLKGIPGKGADLNAATYHWFKNFEKEGFAGNHILEVPHPMAFIVQRASPVFVEAIARQYITGSMLRDYEDGVRKFCGITLPNGLKPNQKLPKLLITPTTKGTLHIPGIPEREDANVTRKQIFDNYCMFGFASTGDVPKYERLLKKGFNFISEKLEQAGQIFVDTKFEFGYITDKNLNQKMIYIDEVGTPDSSRMWDSQAYSRGKIVENSKEGFRQFLLNKLDKDILLRKDRMAERKQLAANYRVPVDVMMEVSQVYKNITEKITGTPIARIENPGEEILEALLPLGIVE
jgi:phosphoribosylaminoimidazole-succinocarboxamide synthase